MFCGDGPLSPVCALGSSPRGGAKRGERWRTNLSVGFAASSPWEGEPRGVAVFHGLAPMGESWRAAPERGYSPHFADQQPVTYVSPETMAAPTGATLPLPSKTQDFHLIRPVFALGTFPSRGRLENAFLFLVLWFLTVSKEARLRNKACLLAYSPLYFRRVAIPPRMWRSALLISRSCRTCL